MTSDARTLLAEIASTEGRPRVRVRPSNVALERTLSVLSPLVLIGVWEVCARIGLLDVRFFPAPSSIFAVLWQMLQPTTQFPPGEMWAHVSISLKRIGIGLALGAVPGVVVGLAVGLFRPVRAVVQPLVDGTFPIPKIALLPLFMLIFGLGEESKYAIIASAVIYLVLINTAAGVRNIERIYLDVGENFHASRMMMFTDIALPGAMPSIVTGIKLGAGVALLVIVAAEFVGAKSGLDYLIWTSWQVFQVEKMYAGLIVIALVGFALAVLLNWLEQRLIPWRRS